MADSSEVRAAKEHAWRTGRLRYLLKGQPCMLGPYDRLHASSAEITYWNIARQTGKSFTGATLGAEQALRKQGGKVSYASQDQKACRDIVFQQMEIVLRDCPGDMLPKFHYQQGEYFWPHNGARFRVAGGDDENQPRLRGKTTDFWIADELAHTRGNKKNLLYSILIPQTNTTGGRGLVMTSPAETAGDFTTQLAYQCQAEGSYEEINVWQNRLMSEEKKRSVLKANGWCVRCWDYERTGLPVPEGLEHTCSTNWQREYLCMFVTDTENAVVPEFNQSAQKEVIRESARPSFFDAYVALDGGFTDPAGLLFAHVDYARAKLVVEGERLLKNALTEDVAKAVSEYEATNWAGVPALKTENWKQQKAAGAFLLRVMDVDPEKASDFMRNHGMAWVPAQKGPGSVKRMANHVNQLIRQRSLEIRPNCVNLIQQLHNAIWAGKKAEDGQTPRKQFARTAQDGHFDLVAALFYLADIADLSHNPFPPQRPDLVRNHVDLEEVMGRQHSEQDQAIIDALTLPELE